VKTTDRKCARNTPRAGLHTSIAAEDVEKIASKLRAAGVQYGWVRCADCHGIQLFVDLSKTCRLYLNRVDGSGFLLFREMPGCDRETTP
jgi:hypothetical protein